MTQDDLCYERTASSGEQEHDNMRGRGACTLRRRTTLCLTSMNDIFFWRAPGRGRLPARLHATISTISAYSPLSVAISLRSFGRRSRGISGAMGISSSRCAALTRHAFSGLLFARIKPSVTIACLVKFQSGHYLYSTLLRHEHLLT